MSWSTLVLALALSAEVEKGRPPATPDPPAYPMRPVPSDRSGPIEALLPPLPELGSEVRMATCTLTQLGSTGKARWQASGQFRVQLNLRGEVVESTFVPKIDSGTTTETSRYPLFGVVGATIERKVTWTGGTERPTYNTVSGPLPNGKPFAGLTGQARYNLELTTETVFTLKVMKWEIAAFRQAESESRMFTVEFWNGLDANWCHAKVYGLSDKHWACTLAKDLLDLVTFGLVRLDDRGETLEVSGLWLQLPAGKKEMTRRGRFRGDDVNYDVQWSKE